MNTSLESFKNLQHSLTHTEVSVSVIQKSSATTEAFDLIDQQVAIINQVNIPGNFQGASEMIAAVQTMKTAANTWQSTKSTVTNAAQEVQSQNDIVTNLGSSATTVEMLQEEVKAFASGKLQSIKNDFSSAKNTFDTFEQNLDNAYSISANANAAASQAIIQNQQELQNSITNLQARENSLKSAGSVILGIFTLGATIIAQINEINNEIGNLHGQQAQLNYETQAYSIAMSGFTNVMNSAKVASYALLTADTSIQQCLNSLNDITASTSTNLIVMKAELDQFKAEYAGAVTAAAGIN